MLLDPGLFVRQTPDVAAPWAQVQRSDLILVMRTLHGTPVDATLTTYVTIDNDNRVSQHAAVTTRLSADQRADLDRLRTHWCQTAGREPTIVPTITPQYEVAVRCPSALGMLATRTTIIHFTATTLPPVLRAYAVSSQSKSTRINQCSCFG